MLLHFSFDGTCLRECKDLVKIMGEWLVAAFEFSGSLSQNR